MHVRINHHQHKVIDPLVVDYFLQRALDHPRYRFKFGVCARR